MSTQDPKKAPSAKADPTPAEAPAAASEKKGLTYSGPVTTIVLVPAKTKAIVPGETYDDLPADNDQVKNLVARGLLKKSG